MSVSDDTKLSNVEHPKLTIGLCYELAQVLERHGIPKAPADRGADWVHACYRFVVAAVAIHAQPLEGENGDGG